MIDIANHIIARNRWKTLETSSDSFKMLAQNGFFSEERLKVLEQMVKFRNRIVHLYYDVDNEEVYRIIKNNLNDFSCFIKGIVEKLF